MTTNDDPVYGPVLNATGLDRVLLPILPWLARERPEEARPVLLALRQAPGKCARGLKTEAGALNFVHPIAHGVA